MKKILLLLFVSSSLFAQKKDFTMQEAVLGLSTTLAVKNLKQLQWMGTSEYYTQFIKDNATQAYLRTNANNSVTDTFITLLKVNEIFSTTEKVMPSMEWVNENEGIMTFSNRLKYKIIRKDAANFITESVLLETPEDAENISFDPSKRHAVYSSKYNLFLQEGKLTEQITSDGSDNLLYGTSVHQNEFGIDGGLFWSPKGNALAFYKMDQSMISDYPIINWLTTPATYKTIKYPFAGNASHHVSLGVYHVQSKKTIYLQTGEPQEQYLTTVTWSPDEKFIYVSLLNRDQNHLTLNQYDATTGKYTKTLFEETNDRYVEPQHQLEFYNNDPTQFIWWSQRDGFMHLYLYDYNGKLIKQLTKGAWIVNEVLGYSKSKNEILFSSSKENVMQKNIFSVNVKSKKIRQVCKTLATHTASVSKGGNYLLDTYTSGEIPRQVDVVKLANGEAKSILKAEPTLDNYNLSTIETLQLKADDNTILHAKLLKPYNFDASKKYPVIVYLYNGPHVQLNKDTYPYSGNLWYDYMTQRGYVVFVLDGRGSANRGFQFESIIHRQLGTIEMQDQMVGVNYLKSLPYVDANKLGIHGWSFGGFMTTSFMLRKPDVFKCGVAGGPVLDWSMYEIMYGERYMDTPQQNPDGYAANVLLDKTKNLKGKLLMIHGADDNVVVWQHSMKFVKKCVDEGVQLDYFVYPGHPHNVRGKDRVHLMQKITDYFDAHLK